MAVPNFPGFNRAARRCSGNWFSNPKECIVGNEYWLRYFHNGSGEELRFLGQSENLDYRGRALYNFDRVNNPGAILSLPEDNGHGCLREIVRPPAQRGGGRRKRRTRHRRKSIKKTKRV